MRSSDVLLDSCTVLDLLDRQGSWFDWSASTLESLKGTGTTVEPEAERYRAGDRARTPLPGRIPASRRARQSRTSMPRSAMYAFASPTVCSPKWKMLAASTASAPPSITPSTR